MIGSETRIPEKITEEDLLQLAVLITIVRGQPVPIGSLNCEITKNRATIELLEQCQNAQLEVVACYPSLAEPSTFFGVAVQSGPIQFHSTEAKIRNAANILQQLENVPENERLEMIIDVGEVYAVRKPECEHGFLVRPISIGEPPVQAGGSIRVTRRAIPDLTPCMPSAKPKITTGKSARVHECVRSNRYDFLGMSLGENLLLNELAACRRERGAFETRPLIADVWLGTRHYDRKLATAVRTWQVLPGSIQQGQGENALTFRCLSVGVRMRFGAACKSLGELSLVRDYIPAFPPAFRRVPYRTNLGRLGH